VASREASAIAAEGAEHALFAAVALDALRVLGDRGLRAQELAQAIFELGRSHQSMSRTTAAPRTAQEIGPFLTSCDKGLRTDRR
jgi:hypothetical protein